MKIRKGSQVRIRRTNQIATIEDIELIRKPGQVHKYCQLKLENKPDLWMDAQELGEVIERVTIEITNHDNGQQLLLELKLNHLIDNLSVEITGSHPENLKNHKGFHASVLSLFLQALKG